MSTAVWVRWLLTAVGVFTAVSPWVFDFGATHMYNDRWPPHAKFHNAQTLLFGTALGLLTAGFAWRRGGDPAGNLLTACVLASLYWVTQAGAGLLPNTALVDPEFVTPDTARLFGVPGVQPAIDAAVLAAVGVAYVAGRRRLAGHAPAATPPSGTPARPSGPS